MKKANLHIILAIVFSTLVGLTGCKPKPISGKLYLTDGSGIASTMPNVQILLIDAKEADDFLAQKSLESKSKCEPLKADIEKLKSENVQNQLDYEKMKLTNADYLSSESYTNDSRYVSLQDELSNYLHSAEVMAKAIQYLKSKYGENPYNGINPVVTHFTKEQMVAFDAQRQDMQAFNEASQNATRVSQEMDSFEQKVRNEATWNENQALGKVERTKMKINSDTDSINKIQSPSFYFDGFSPHVIEMALTDGDGNFVINHPRVNAKIFAKIVLDEPKLGIYWIVDLPPIGQKLILSDNNVFKLSVQN